MKEVIVPATHSVSVTVTENLTAKAMGSGSLPVYATPAMAALMEQASAELANRFLDEGETTVGTALSLEHLAASPVGIKITAEATLIENDRRRFEFEVVVKDEKEVIGKAKHTRFLVYAEKFLEKANSKL